MKQALPLLALLLSATLTGCNNDRSDPTPTPEPKSAQKGFGESELYDPIHHQDGHFITPTQTAVLELEGMNGTPAPDPGDTATAGVDEMWFEVAESGGMSLSIREETLATIAQAELWNTTGGLLIRINSDTRQGEAELTPGRYGLRLYAAHHESNPVNLFIQLKEYPTDPASANRTLMANPDQVNLTLQTKNCPECDLTGADLRKARLAMANLNGAKLVRANLSRAILGDAQLIGADLHGANLGNAELGGANLTRANLTGANLTAANLYAANLTEADLTGANLSYATWIDGNTCEFNSIGQCNY